MVALSRCLGSAALLIAGAECARVSRKRRDTNPAAKFIAGVPIVNYHAAYGGSSSLSSLEEAREEEWLVSLQPGATDAQIAGLCKMARNGCKMVGHPDKGGVPFLEMEGTEGDLEAVIKSSRHLVKFAEPNQPIEMIPEFPEEASDDASWGLTRVGAGGRSGAQGSGTHVYILDTGVRTTHTDFGTRAAPGADLSSGSLVECNGDLTCAADRQGHGTHCAGTAAGSTFGVASQANVYGVKVLGDSGAGGFDAIIGGIDFAAASDARPAVGSMSLGGQCPLGWCGLFGVVKDAVNTAVQNGVTIVVAGGNSNGDACGFVPAFVPSAITVGSTTSLDARSEFSNYGSCTNIWAPGSRITSASHEDDSGSKTFSGTSMACPHVAGAAAITLEQNPTFKSEQVLETLLNKAATNYITDLQTGDTNKLLYIAPDAPPPLGEVPPLPEPSCPFYCFVCLTPACKGCCD